MPATSHGPPAREVSEGSALSMQPRRVILQSFGHGRYTYVLGVMLRRGFIDAPN